MSHLALLTTFNSFDDSYSLCNVVLDQCRAALQEGMQVSIWTLKGVTEEKLPEDLQGKVKIQDYFKAWTWEEDVIEEEESYRIALTINKNLPKEASEGVVITHDLLFQTAFLTYAKALHHVDVPGWRFYHMAHSAPGPEPILSGPASYRSQCPTGHKIISLNYCNAAQMARYYQTDISNVVSLPNAKDIASFLGFTKRVSTIVSEYGLAEKDVVQIYPLSMTRCLEKGLGIVIHAFGELQKKGKDAALIIADAHGTDERCVQIRQDFDDYCWKNDIHNIIWLSDCPHGAAGYNGVSNREIAQLMQVANLFMFPTKSEACPLVLLEAALSGCLLVLNSDVEPLSDIIPYGDALYYPMGKLNGESYPIPFSKLVSDIVEKLDASLPNRTKRRVLKHYNYKAIGRYLTNL